MPSQQSLCWTGIHTFCGCVSDGENCKVRITFAFLGFSKNVLSHLDCRLGLSICLLMAWAACSVLKSSFSSEQCKFRRGELWSIVRGYNIWNAVSCEVVLQLPDACGDFHVSASVNFPEIGKTVHSDEVVFPINGAVMSTAIFPQGLSGASCLGNSVHLSFSFCLFSLILFFLQHCTSHDQHRPLHQYHWSRI